MAVGIFRIELNYVLKLDHSLGIPRFFVVCESPLAVLGLFGFRRLGTSGKGQHAQKQGCGRYTEIHKIPPKDNIAEIALCQSKGRKYTSPKA